jgi:uncharacterized tellurite resistance protein B-like protein
MKFIRFMEGGEHEGADRRAAESGAETETVRRIVRALDRLEPERARFMAAFAYLLGRVAGADLKISDDEVQVMERLIVERCGLEPAQAILVAQMAKTQTLLFGGTENYLVAREFGQIATREQSLGLLECLFAVAAADGSISVVEDNEIRRISNELRLTHEEFIQARSEYHDYLAVLRGRPD